MGTRQALPTTFQGYLTSYNLEENKDMHLQGIMIRHSQLFTLC